MVTVGVTSASRPSPTTPGSAGAKPAARGRRVLRDVACVIVLGATFAFRTLAFGPPGKTTGFGPE
jgi:hypothetical protein